MPEYIDIHSHTFFPNFKNDQKEIENKALENNVWFMNVGTDLQSSKRSIEIAEEYQNGVFACIGLHPTHSNEEKFDIEEYRKLVSNPKVKAIGECGLDYFRMEKDTKEEQIEIFKKQIELSIESDKPLMLHIRDAYEDSLSVLKQYPKSKGNVHFFAGDYETAKKFIDIGFTLSFTGVITFANSYDEVIKNIPLNMIMSETNSPFVAPIPYRGKRNEPIYVKEVVKKIAEIRGEDIEKVKTAIIANAKRVFDF
jgi:TatD DNase family protein